MAVRISRVIAILNIDRQVIEDFLNKKGIKIETGSRATIDDDVYDMLLKEFEANMISRQEPRKRKRIGRSQSSQNSQNSQSTQKNPDIFYLIDTNVFIKCPDIISRIPKEYPIVLSAKVLDELDYLKVSLEDEDDKSAAQKALKYISKVKGHNISYEFSDVNLLPPDLHKKNADNMILSIALKYKMRGDKLTILTQDNGMIVKANALDIETISLDDFLAKIS